MTSEPPVVMFPKHVAFIEKGSRVVTGTDTSKAVVYETQTGKVVQTLQYPENALVQPVSVRFHTSCSFNVDDLHPGLQYEASFYDCNGGFYSIPEL